MKEIKDQIYIKCGGWYMSDLIKEIQPQLKKDHDLWLKGGFAKKEGKKTKEFQNFIKFLELKYEPKSKIKKKKR